MKIPLYLLLLFLIITDCCKVYPPAYPHSESSDISYTTPAYEDEDEDDEYVEDSYGAKSEAFEPTTLTAEGYLMLIHNTKMNTNATGVRVLPSILATTSSIIQHYHIKDFVVFYMNRKGKVRKRKVFNWFASDSEDRQFGFMSLRRKPVRIRTVGLRTVPLITRTDTMVSLQCESQVILGNLTVVKEKVAIHNKSPDCNMSRICAEPTRRVCQPAEGMVLMCHNRLNGIRIDDEFCVSPPDIYIFSNIRYHDYWAIGQLYPRGYFDYHIKGRYLVKSVGNLRLLKTILYRITSNVLFLYYYLRNKLL